MSALAGANSDRCRLAAAGAGRPGRLPHRLLAGSWLSDESQRRKRIRAIHQATGAVGGTRQSRLSRRRHHTAGQWPADFVPLAAPLNVGDDTVRATLAKALATPVTGSTTTIMLNQSIAGLADVTGALSNRIGVLPPHSTVGLWVFNGFEGVSSAVPTGLLSDQVNGQGRPAALAAVLAGTEQTNRGASFTTPSYGIWGCARELQGRSAELGVGHHAGPHTDQTLDGPGLQQYIQSALDQNRPVDVNVIDIGNDPDQSTWASRCSNVRRNVPGGPQR